MEKILSLNKLNKSYKDFKLKDVSFSLPRGYIMGFIGKNGAGKTTTLNCITGINNYDSGEIRVNNEIMRKDNSCQLKSVIGFVGEKSNFYEDMTVGWTGDFAGKFYGNWNSSQFDRYCERFSLNKKKKIKELSKGMKTKLGLAIALSHKAELLILDEPTSGLDPDARMDLLEIFQEIIMKEEASIIFSSHITSDIRKIADFVTMIDDGRIILSDDKDSLLDNYNIVQIDEKYWSEELAGLFVKNKKIKNGYKGLCKDPEKIREEIIAKFPSAEIFVEKADLEEIFLQMIGG